MLVYSRSLLESKLADIICTIKSIRSKLCCVEVITLSTASNQYVINIRVSQIPVLLVIKDGHYTFTADPFVLGPTFQSGAGPVLILCHHPGHV